MSWKTKTLPPKNEQKVVKLRFQLQNDPPQTGLFTWSNGEETWVECNVGPDGIALYEDLGYKVTGWKNPSKKDMKSFDVLGK